MTSNYIHRAWGYSRPDEDVVDIYVTRYWRDPEDGEVVRHYGLFSPIEGIEWCVFQPRDVIRPFLSINGLACALALETVDLGFISQLTDMGRRVMDATNDLTYVKP